MTNRWKWLGFKRETSRSTIKWEVGGAIWLHDKTAEGGKARRLIAALHLGTWTAAVGYELTPPPAPPPHCSRGRASGDTSPDLKPVPPRNPAAEDETPAPPSKQARAELQARLRTANRLARQGDAEDEAPAGDEGRAPCPHENLVTCEGPGVACEACDALLAWCGAGAHVSERLWNRACANDKEAPADQDRETHCAICGDQIVPLMALVLP